MKAKNAVESLREVVQDLLVPDMKALKVGLDSHRNETKLQTDGIRSEITSLRNELHLSVDSLRNELNLSVDSLRTEMRLRDEKQSQAIQALSDKIGYALDIRERLAVLEDRANRPS
jgi:hypothetical protein